MSKNAVAECLNQLLGSANVFARKVKHYHWNVRGRQFFTLHVEFEKLYDEWAEYADAIAERVVALGGRPLVSLAEDIKTSKLKEETQVPDSDAMVKNLIADMQTLRGQLAETFDAASSATDRTTEDLVNDVRDSLDKKLWMFQAYIA